ncbi:gamma-glutamyltransferase family protein [Schauerella aestuarii]|uniref:gamma-glutamyltransferase family protein n=1 Tax=Schauerella aestuarii TaxID=2511204 RepID=UPI001368FBA8|nr:gamma-glutamyltransferase family protein [Achromobacter aestuarii]MYZ44446.1 gamma-glutamyltransferase family protein [Achromobacter aestuarii]
MHATQRADDLTQGSAPLAMRPTLAGLNHMISAGHYLATQAGMDILQAGGNAIDAGVAAGIALGVVQSDIVNFGGVAPCLVYHAETQKVWSISGLGYWPQAATLDLFLQAHGGKIPAGVLRTVIPAAPDAWITALERFGTMSFGDVAAAAIGYARDGFVMYPLMAEVLADHAQDYGRWASSAAVYLPDGRPPAAGDIFRQSDLARTLQYMADEERAHGAAGRAAGLAAARHAFYRGDIAKSIVAFHRAEGGLVTHDDLANFSVEVEPALSTDFRGTQLYSCGFWCQGPTLLQMLNILESRDVAALGHNSAAYVHLLTETIKLAFADREAHYGDPRYRDIPQAALLSKAYALDRLGLISDDRALPDMPSPGEPGLFGGRPVHSDKSEDRARTDPRLDTSYVAVVDRHGNAFSATPSDGSYNSPIIPGTGICASGRGSQSWAEAGHPCAIAPGHRPRLTPNPSLAIRPGQYVMPFGTPGGDVQCQAMLQTFLNVEVFGMDLQAAIEAPRFATFSFPSSFEPHNVQPGRLMLEDLIARHVGDALNEKGHAVQWWRDRNWRAGAMCAVKHDVTTGIRWGAADPRRPAYAAGC